MSYTENIKSYARLSMKINKKYADTHGYFFFVGHENMKKYNKAPQWCKILLIKQLLEDPAMKNVDYFFWIDADAIFNKQDVKIEQFIEKHSFAEIIICDDNENSGRTPSINTGTMIVRNSDWNRNFFNQIWNYDGVFNWKPVHEQAVMEQLIFSNQDVLQKIAIVNGKQFNSYFYQLLNSERVASMLEQNFVIHLMATNANYRIKFFRTWLKTCKNEIQKNDFRSFEYKK